MSQAISCACGAVTGSVIPKGDAGVCHCATCRKWSGGAYIAVTCEDVVLDDPSQLNVWISSDWGERVSCVTCGSTLIWRMRDGSHNSVSVQAFDDPSRFPLETEIFIDDKPAGYDFMGDHDRLTSAEVMARYAGGKEAET